MSQDDFGKGGNERVVHGSNERGFLAPVMSGSITRTQTPPTGILHVHLTVITISLLEEVDYEPGIPELYRSKTTTLWWGANVFVCVG